MASALHVLVITLVALHIGDIGASAMAQEKLVTRMVTGGTGTGAQTHTSRAGPPCLCVWGAQPVTTHPVLLMFNAIALMTALASAANRLSGFFNRTGIA